MPVSSEYIIPNGWLRKACRFGIMNQLKLRYFVLLDTELRYYKYPDDPHPAGMIELKDFSNVQIYNTTSTLFGFKLVPKSKGSWKPMLYADSEQERQRWMSQIQNKIDRLDFVSVTSSRQYYTPPKEQKQDVDEYDSVLDKWLFKLNLHDQENDNSQLLADGRRTHSRSYSNTSIVSKNRSLEYIDKSLYSEPSLASSNSVSSSSSASSLFLKAQDNRPRPQRASTISLESAQRKYTEITRLYQHRFTNKELGSS